MFHIPKYHNELPSQILYFWQFGAFIIDWSFIPASCVIGMIDHRGRRAARYNSS